MAQDAETRGPIGSAGVGRGRRSRKYGVCLALALLLVSTGAAAQVPARAGSGETAQTSLDAVDQLTTSALRLYPDRVSRHLGPSVLSDASRVVSGVQVSGFESGPPSRSDAVRAFFPAKYSDGYVYEAGTMSIVLRPLRSWQAGAVRWSNGVAYLGAFPGVNVLRLAGGPAAASDDFFQFLDESSGSVLEFEVVALRGVKHVFAPDRPVMFAPDLPKNSPQDLGSPLVLEAPRLVDSAGRQSDSARWEVVYNERGLPRILRLRIDSSGLTYPILAGMSLGFREPSQSVMLPSASASKTRVREKSSAGLISGRLTDTVAGMGVSGQVQVFDTSGAYVSSGSADSSGNWTTSTGLLTGTYYALGYPASGSYSPSQELFSGIDCTNSCSVTAGTPISVVEGSTTSGVDFQFAPPGAVAGSVIDAATGLPVANVNVYLYNSAGGFVGYGYTDTSGNYSTNAYRPTPTGTYYVRTYNSSGYVDQVYDNILCQNCDPTTGTPISVAAGSTTPNINFALHVAGLISGRLTDTVAGMGVSGQVQVFDTSGAYVSSGSADSSGNWTTSTGLLTGTYYALGYPASGSYSPSQELFSGIDCTNSCSVTAGTPISVVEGSTTSGVDFQFAPPGAVAGSVIDAATGLPVANVNVYLYNSAGGFVGYGYTDTSGNYSTNAYRPTPTGTYYVRTYNSSGYVDQVYDNILCQNCDPTTGTPISVAAGSTTPNINFALHVAGLISGRLTDTVAGMGVSGQVQVFDTSGAYVSSGSADSSGNWTTSTGLLTGTYYALGYPASGSYSPSQELFSGIDCTNSCSVTAGTPISVVEGSTTSGVDFQFAPPGAVAGSVIDAATGLPVANVNVYLYNSAGGFVGYGYTDTSGNYSTNAYRPTPTGTYYVRTYNSSGYVDQVYDNILCQNCDPTTGTPISVAAGSTTPNINFAMGSGSCTPISVLPVTLANGTVGAPYSQVLSAAGGVGPYTFSRFSGALPDGVSLDPESGLLAGAPTTRGTFTFTVTATDQNGCVGRRTYTVIVVDCPVATASASGPTTFCQGGAVVLTASAGSSYLWSNGSSAQSISVTDPGTYFVTVTSSSGCSSVSNPVVVTVNPPPSASVTPAGPLTLPFGSSATLTASAGASWLWSTGETTQAITVSTSGNYTVTVTNAFGCSSSSAPVAVTVSTTSADIQMTLTANPTSASVGGQTITLSLNASNAGPSDASGIKATIPLPAGLAVLAVEPPPTPYDPNTGIWSIGPLQSGTAVAIQILVQVAQPGQFSVTATKTAENEPDPDTANDSATVAITGQPTADVHVTMTVDNPSPLVGQSVKFLLTTANSGPSDATGVQVTDLLPPGLQFGSASPSGSTTYDSSTGFWAVGSLANGASATLSIVATVTQPGLITNNATKTAENEVDPNPGSDTAAASLNAQTVADIQIQAAVSNGMPDVGQNVVVRVVATNAGPSPATGVKVTDLLPAALVYVSAIPSPGTSYNPTTGLWDVGALAASTNATLQITAKVNGTGTIVDTASRTAGDQSDPNPANDSSSVTLNGQPSADIQVAQSASSPSVAVGQSLQFTISATNLGPSSASGVQVTDALPAGLTFVSAMASQGSYNSGNGALGRWIDRAERLGNTSDCGRRGSDGQHHQHGRQVGRDRV